MTAAEIITSIHAGLPMGLWLAGAIVAGALSASTWIIFGARNEKN